jgi:hypothetical protein
VEPARLKAVKLENSERRLQKQATASSAFPAGPAQLVG